MTDPESFEHAFVVAATLLGCRTDPAGGLARPTAAARTLATRLGEGDRNLRAQRLAIELRPLADALDRRCLR